MKIVFLGVGGGVPSLRRALPAIAAVYRGQILLFDCGEGTQFQFQRAGLSIQRVKEIFISHLHGDHVLGLPGILSSMALLHRTKPLVINGPQGLKDFIALTLELTNVQKEFELTLHEVKQGIISKQTQYQVECLPAIHSLPSLSFILRMADTPGRFKAAKAKRLGIPHGPLRKQLQQGQPVTTSEGRVIQPNDVLGPSRKGVSFVYSGDTAPNLKLAEAAKHVTLMVHDATFLDEHRERASEYLHSTAMQAAQIALQAKVTQLALIHISPRYQTSKKHVNEAAAIFSSCFAPKDLDVIELRS